MAYSAGACEPESCSSIGQAGPLVADARRQLARPAAPSRSSAVAGALARRGGALDLQRRARRCSARAWASRYVQCAVAKAENGTMLPRAVAHVPAVEILRQHAERRVALHEDLLDAAAVDEVVDVGRAPGGAERVVDVGDRQARARWPSPGRCRAGTAARRPGRWGAPRRAPGPCAPGRAAGCAPHQRVVADARRGPPARSRSRWRCRAPSTAGGAKAKTCASADLAEAPVGARRRWPARVLVVPRALAPVLQPDEGDAGVLAVAAEAEAGDGEHDVDDRSFSSFRK